MEVNYWQNTEDKTTDEDDSLLFRQTAPHGGPERIFITEFRKTMTQAPTWSLSLSLFFLIGYLKNLKEGTEHNSSIHSWKWSAKEVSRKFKMIPWRKNTFGLKH